MLDDLRESLLLPSSQWIIQATESVAEIRVCKLQHVASVRLQSVVSHSLIINSDLTWSAFVHGHSVDGSKSQILSAIPVKFDCESLHNLLSKLDKSSVCPGHPDKHFLEMVLSKKGNMTSKSGEVIASVDAYAPVQLNGETYTQTVRNKKCEVIVGGSKCSHCVAYRLTLCKLYHRWNTKRYTSPTQRTSSTTL